MNKLVDVDIEGFKHKVLVPEDATPDLYESGLLVGPPSFEDVYPYELAKRLNNELFARGVITLKQASSRRTDMQAALQAALRIDLETMLTIYDQMK